MSSRTACINMIKQQLRTSDVLNDSILNLFETMDRASFVPQAFKEFAYSDMQINLPHQQRMMTPVEEAKLLQSLSLAGHEVVLEIGTGTGFLTALLSKLSKKVISVDYFSEFTLQAKKKLAEHECNNVDLITGDGSHGWLDKAPYDVIVFTGAMETITETQRLQVLLGGKMFLILGKEPVMQGQLHTLNHNGQWHEELIFETNIPPLVDKSKPKEFVF